MSKKERLKGNGWFVERGYIYVQGSINGKFRRKSTKLKATKNNLAYIKKNARRVLEELYSEFSLINVDFTTFAREVIASGAKRPGRAKGRGELDQKNAISKLERFIIPEFKNMPLNAIKAAHIEKWQDKLLAKGYSSSTVAKCRNLMRQIMHKAVANDLATKNPVDYAEGIEVTYNKTQGYTVEEAKRMMQHAKGWFKLYLTLAFTTGMRTGELMALMWSDIDFDLGCIYLERSVTKGVMSIGSNNTKNHKRVVYLLPKVVEQLKEAQKEATSRWMFPNNKGTHYKESKAIVKRYLKPLLKELNIEYRTLYATRHTFATMAENAMLNQAMLNDMIGNSAEVRANHYVTHKVTPERVAAAQEQLTKVANLLQIS